MGKVGSFIWGALCGAAVLYIAMHYHVVRGREGVFVIPKVQQNLSHVYVDTREFTLDDWQQHRALAMSILKAQRGEMLQDAALDDFRSGIREFLGGWLGAGGN